jgi:hypothetical protein
MVYIHHLIVYTRRSLRKNQTWLAGESGSPNSPWIFQRKPRFGQPEGTCIWLVKIF